MMKKRNWFMRHKRIAILSLLLIGGLSVWLVVTVAQEHKRALIVQQVAQKAAADAAICRVDAGKLLEYVNAERARLGAPALQIDSTLTMASKYKLDNMITGKYFSHKMADGTEWYAHARGLGVKGSVAENLGINDLNPEKSWEEFKASPPHYKAFVDPRYTRVGISVQCTDYVQEKAVEPGDEAHIGSKVLDLTVVTLSTPSLDGGGTPPQVQPQSVSNNSGCVTSTIKRSTKHQQASWLNQGETKTMPGFDGATVTCNGVLVSNLRPIDDIVYQGTYIPSSVAIPPTPAPQPSQSEEAQRSAKIAACVQKMQSVSPGSSAYMQCYTAF